jgi:hypothetical protein
VDHLLYDCSKLRREREKLISNISKQDKWPVNKSDLVKKHIKYFIQFAESIDFEKNIKKTNLFKTEKNIQILLQVLIFLHIKTECKSHTNSQTTNMEH